MCQYWESLTYICNLATPATSPIRPLNLDPWPCALWVVKSQFALHGGSEFQWSVFHTGRAPLCFSHTLTHTENTGPIQQPCSHLVCPLAPLWHCLWKHVHLVLPCLPPLPLWCRLPTSWVTFIHLFFLPFPLCSSYFNPPHPHLPALSPPSPAHWKCCLHSHEWNGSVRN